MSKISKKAFISKNVKIGNNVVIHPFVSIYPNVTIQDNVEIFPGAVIGKLPKGANALSRNNITKDYTKIV